MVPLSLLPKRTAAWFSRVNLPSPSGLSNSVAKRPILPQAKLPQLLNERAARNVRRREVHLFPAVAPLHIRAGATSPHGFKESQCGAVGGPLARSPMRLKPCRQKSRSPAPSQTTPPPATQAPPLTQGRLWGTTSSAPDGAPAGACPPVLAEKCPPDISPGARTPLHRGAWAGGATPPLRED